MVKVGIVGAGQISMVHAEAYKLLSNKVQVIGIADKNITKANKLAEIFKAQVYNNADDLYEQDIDIVDVCLPTFLHKDFTVKAAKKRKHVFCEKPMALSINDADCMIDAAENAGVKLMIGHCLRFWEEYIVIREKLKNGSLGIIKTINAGRIGTIPTWSEDNWMMMSEQSGGAAVDLHIHDVDFINSVIPNKPAKVMAVGAYSKFGSMDQINTLIQYNNGQIANIEANWLVPSNYPFTMYLRAVCENGTIEFQYKAGNNIEKRNETESKISIYQEQAKLEEIVIINPKDAYLSELEYFIDWVENGQNPDNISPYDARESLRVVLSAREAAKEGKMIEL